MCDEHTNLFADDEEDDCELGGPPRPAMMMTQQVLMRGADTRTKNHQQPIRALSGKARERDTHTFDESRQRGSNVMPASHCIQMGAGITSCHPPEACRHRRWATAALLGTRRVINEATRRYMMEDDNASSDCVKSLLQLSCVITPSKQTRTT